MIRARSRITLIVTTAITLTYTTATHAETNEEANAWDTWLNSELTLSNSERALSKLTDIQLELRMQRELERIRNRPSTYIPPPPKHEFTVDDPYTYDPTRPGFSFPYKP